MPPPHFFLESVQSVKSVDDALGLVAAMPRCTTHVQNLEFLLQFRRCPKAVIATPPAWESILLFHLLVAQPSLAPRVRREVTSRQEAKMDSRFRENDATGRL